MEYLIETEIIEQQENGDYYATSMHRSLDILNNIIRILSVIIGTTVFQWIGIWLYEWSFRTFQTFRSERKSIALENRY